MMIRLVGFEASYYYYSVHSYHTSPYTEDTCWVTLLSYLYTYRSAGVYLHVALFVIKH